MCCLKCCHRSGVMTREETKQLAHENVSEGFLECMGRDAHVSTCCTAHRRMAHDGQKSPQQRTTSCHIGIISIHIMSIHVYSSLMFWKQPLWHHLALDIIEFICGCWTLLLLHHAWDSEKRCAQRVQDPRCLAERTRAVVCLEAHRPFCSKMF